MSIASQSPLINTIGLSNSNKTEKYKSSNTTSTSYLILGQEDNKNNSKSMQNNNNNYPSQTSSLNKPLSPNSINAASTRQPPKEELIIGYWGFAGRNIPILLLLEILGVSYKTQIFDQNTWFGSSRDSLELDFPNLPFLIDTTSGARITELHNIINYILFKYGKSHNLEDIIQPSRKIKHSQLDTFKIDEIRFMLNDIFTQISSAASKSTEEQKQKQAQDSVTPKLHWLLKFVESKYPQDTTPSFIMGYLSLADVYFYIIAKYFSKYFPKLYQGFANTFDSLVVAFEALPPIAEFISSPRFPPLG